MLIDFMSNIRNDNIISDLDSSLETSKVMAMMEESITKEKIIRRAWVDLLVASEIGSAKFIAEFLKNEEIFFLAGSDIVEDYFKKNTLYKPYSSQECFPKNIYLGSTIGPSLEREIFLDYKQTNARIISFIDSPWNISQRFIDEKTGIKWSYSPKEIVLFYVL